MLFGLLQGSVLVPLPYILYSADLSRILSEKGVTSHQYGDDTRAAAAATIVGHIVHAHPEHNAWTSSNHFRLNSRLNFG